MADKALNLLGLAFKARAIVCGEDAVITEMKKNKAKLVFVASDCSEKTISKFRKKCYFYKVPCIFKYDSSDISNSIGKYNHIIAINDANFYGALLKYLESEIEFYEG